MFEGIRPYVIPSMARSDKMMLELGTTYLTVEEAKELIADLQRGIDAIEENIEAAQED